MKTDRINFLVQKLYKALGKTASSFTAELTQGIPHVTNLDETTAGLSYFSALTALNIYGEIDGDKENSAAVPKLSAFLNMSSLTSFINRFTIGHPTVSRLTMRNCAQNYVAFDIVNLARLQGLTYLDLSFNTGIKGINSLVDLNMAQLQYLNVRKINPSCTFEYQEYALSNLYANYTGTAQQLLYSDDGGFFRDYLIEGRSKDAAESLTYLNEFGEIRSEYLHLCRQIYTDTGADEIYWRIESGNMMTLVASAGAVPEIDNAAGMDALRANYYYCAQSFAQSGTNFEKGRIYKLSYQNGTLAFTLCDVEILAEYSDTASFRTALENGSFTDEEKANALQGSNGESTPVELKKHESERTKTPSTVLVSSIDPWFQTTKVTLTYSDGSTETFTAYRIEQTGTETYDEITEYGIYEYLRTKSTHFS